MNETIRNYIRRRVWWCVGSGIAGWLMLPLGTAIAKSLPDGVAKAVVPLVGIVMFGGAILAMQMIVRCPKCKARLTRTIAMPVAFSWGSGPRINFCPYCGVNLEDPLPRSEPVAQSQNPIHPA